MEDKELRNIVETMKIMSQKIIDLEKIGNDRYDDLYKSNVIARDYVADLLASNKFIHEDALPSLQRRINEIESKLNVLLEKDDK